jgi:hypothetical protein
VTALWAAAQLPILLAVCLGVMTVAVVVGSQLWPRLFGEDVSHVAVPVGLLAGVGTATAVIYRARVWLHRMRLWRLRRWGARAVATAVWIEGDPTNPTALEGYVVFVRWRDLAGEHLGERCYRFWLGAPHGFLSRFAHGKPVVVRYPRAQPRRFVIDIPYAPSIADAFI